MIKNIKKSPITSILGTLLVLTGMFLLIYPMIKGIERDVTGTQLVILFTFGVGLLVAPDNLLAILKDKIKL